MSEDSAVGGGGATGVGPSPALIEDITLTNAVIAEGVAGAGAGNLAVVDSEAAGPYSFSVEDPLFEIRLISEEPIPALFVKPDQVLDFETQTSHEVTVFATDALGRSFSKPFVITVLDVDETPPPSAISLSNTQVGENVAGAGVGQLSVTDADQTGGHTLSLDNPLFVLQGDLVFLAPDVSFDYESTQAERLTVTAIDADGQSFSETFSIDVVNDPSDDPLDEDDGPPDPGDDIDVLPIFASFESGIEDFAFEAVDATYAMGGVAEGAGLDESAALELVLGGRDDDDVEALSAAFRRDFSLTEAGQVTLSFWYDFSQTAAYEEEEVSRLLVRLDDEPPEGELIVELAGGGETGWQQVSLDLGVQAAGVHSLTIGAENSRKTYRDEETRLLLDDILVSVEMSGVAAVDAPLFDAQPASPSVPEETPPILA